MQKTFSYKALIAIVVLGTILRAVNLFWGSPFFFHPDERNIANAISGMRFPDQLNPHFFAYGSLPIYVTFFLGLVKNLFSQEVISPNKVGFEDAVVILRFFSFLFSCGTILLVYKIGALLKNKSAGIISAYITSTGVGMIQYAHFGTFEMWLTFFLALLFLSVLLYQKSPSLAHALLLAFSLSVLIGVKISSVIYLPFISLIFFQKNYTLIKKSLIAGGALLSAAIFYSITNPFTFLDTRSFINSITYESNVALGKIVVFYTGEFLTATPIVFPFLKIYPHLVNPIHTVLIPLSIAVLIITLTKKFNIELVYLLIFFFTSFLSQTFLFAQWTRYFVPTLPFIYLMLSLTAIIIYESSKKNKKTLIFLGGIAGVLNLVFAFSFVKTVYLEKDTRIEAVTFAKINIPTNKKILSEIYDLGIIPFNQYYPSVELFNFYDLENNSPDATLTIYKDKIAQSDYLVLPSQRLYQTRLHDPVHFPKGNKIYKQIDNSTTYKKIYETPCDFWCKIAYSFDPIFGPEQTVNVFDRPTVMIFKINYEK
ncbi:MAG: glycosyltransferase family 39 protein [Candidatus Levybacteria bacterium]|nr:glycosyltransferase family 39 protein [Candidatus Levybacteria bacterium]